MSQAPYMPVFTDALLGDTLNLTAEEFGAYCLLLFATWRNNGEPLADDDGMLRRVVRCSAYKWRRLRTVLVKFFNLDDGTWRQKRLEKEWRRTQEIIAAKRRKDGDGTAPEKSDENFSKKFSATSLNPNETEKQPNLGYPPTAEIPRSPPSAGDPHARAREAPSASPPDGGQGREPPEAGKGVRDVPASSIRYEIERCGAEVAQRALHETEKRLPSLRSPKAYFHGICRRNASSSGPETAACRKPQPEEPFLTRGPPGPLTDEMRAEVIAMLRAA